MQNIEPDTNNKNAEEIFSELNLETAKIAWNELQRFFAAGSLIWVDASLDLVQVAVEIAQDNKQYIEEQMNLDTIKPVEDEQAKSWQDTQPNLWAVVVKPWVLVQEKDF
jgi:hypothetical protein